MTLSDCTFIRAEKDHNELVTLGGTIFMRTGEVIGFKELKSKIMTEILVLEMDTKKIDSKQLFSVIDYFIDFEI